MNKAIRVLQPRLSGFATGIPVIGQNEPQRTSKYIVTL